MIVALIALFVALGGVAGAATTMITTQMIRDNAVTRGKIATNSINSAKIEDGSIQSKDLSGNIRGEKGVAGAKGGAGEAGARGPAGEKGEAGATGPAGVAGSSGPTGPTGAAGATGATGPAGPIGATGAQGPAGVTEGAGPAGATGPAGPTGATGSQGPAGADGRTVLSGTGNPASGTGANGDFYINTTTNTLFGPKASGAWPSGTSLVGPTGATGPTGAQGATGPSNIIVGVNVYDGTFLTNSTERLSNITLDQGSWLIVASGTLGGYNNYGSTMGYNCDIYDAAGTVVTPYPVAASWPAISGSWSAPFTLMHPVSVATATASFSLRCYFGGTNASVHYGEYPNMYAIKTASLTVSSP
jgi:hypothetical protein